MAGGWAALTVLLVLGRARSSEPEHHSLGEWEQPLAVEWSHCGVEMRDSMIVCAADPADPVRLWIDHSRAAEARVRVDGVEVPVEPFTVAEEPLGQGLRVPIPEGALELEVVVPDAEGTRGWAMMLGRAHLPADEARNTEAITGWSEALGGTDLDRMERTTTRLSDLLLEAGRVQDATLVLIQASFHLRALRAFDATERLLERAQAIGGAIPMGRMMVSSHQGLLVWSRGAFHEAAPLLRDGARLSLRLEEPLGMSDSLPIYAEVLARLGYYEEARHWTRKSLENRTATACDQASVLRTAGWINLVLHAREQPHDDPVPLLERAIDLYLDHEDCAHKTSGARLSLALLAFGDGDSDEAERHLHKTDVGALNLEDRVRAADLRVRLALALDDVVGAWYAWGELEAAAHEVDDDDARWREQVRLGELLSKGGDQPGALAALELAEQRLDRLVRMQAVVGVARTATADRYLEGTTELVSLLVDQGQHERAFCVAREARARRRSAAAGLDALPKGQREAMREKIRVYHEHKRRAEQTQTLIDARPRAQEPILRHDASRAVEEANALVDEVVEALMLATASPRCDGLVPPAPGELLVGLYPCEDEWLLFAQGEHETSAAAVPAPTPAELVAGPSALGRLLAPIAGALAGATSVRVLADREAELVDVHSIPLDGRPLLARLPVTYGVELPVLEPPADQDPPRALLLADPTGTLMSAKAEVEMIARELVDARWEVAVPRTSAAEASSELSLSGYTLLHYAAHTATNEDEVRVWAPYPAGEAGRLPHLQVGPKARLEVHDILARRPVPPVAFLAGCKTGLVELDAGSTSLALAFLLADGQQVVASRENVDDAVGLEIARRFYARFGRSAGADAAMALHEVQAELLAEGREQAVPYRVWVR